MYIKHINMQSEAAVATLQKDEISETIQNEVCRALGSC
jgi:hypothetical protein